MALSDEEQAAIEAERVAERAELATLKAEREEAAKAKQAERDAELEELRKFKAERDKAPVVTPPKKKEDKVLPGAPPVNDPPKKRSGVSRAWFGESADD